MYVAEGIRQSVKVIDALFKGIRKSETLGSLATSALKNGAIKVSLRVIKKRELKGKTRRKAFD